MSESPNTLAGLSPEAKRKLLAELLRDKANAPGPLSYGQRALWYLHRLEPDSAFYNVPWAWRIRSAVNVPALEQAFQSLVDRHRILRTTFADQDGQPVARAAERARVDFESVAAADWSDEQLRARASTEAHRPFDLEQGPLMRVRLYTRGPSDHVLLVTLHHIAYDLWSMMTLLNELGVLYVAHAAGAAPGLPKARQYDEFVRWQSEMLAQPAGEQAGKYWEQQMAGDPAPLALPTDRSRSAARSFDGRTHTIAIDDQLAAGLRTLSQSSGNTLYTILLAAFDVLLSRYTGQDDIVVGSPMTGRSRPEFQDLVGYCLNTMPLRVDLGGDPTFAEAMCRVRQTVLGALEHQDYPFALLVERLRPARGGSQSALFQVMFALNKPHRREEQAVSLSETGGAGGVELGGLVLESFPLAQQTTADDLVLLVYEVGDSLTASWQYSTDLFDEATIARMAQHYQALLQSIVDAPDAPISRLSIVSPGERADLVAGRNATRRDYPQLSIAAAFEDQVSRTPDAVALVFESEEWTYRELNGRANRLARYLMRRGVGPDVLVGVFVERSPDMIVGLLAILKAGGAYLPLDPDYPKERLAFMVQDAAAPVLLTTSDLLNRLPEHAAGVVCLDRERAATALEDETNPPHRAAADHLAYVTFTSGSTGTPKGVEVRNRGVLRLVFGTAFARFDDTRRFLQLAPVSFDASTFEIWGALLHGARLVLFPGAVPTADELGETLHRHRITTLWLTASLFNAIVDERPDVLDEVEQLLIGGEALSVTHVRRAQSRLPRTEIINGYGPTESTTFTCCYAIPRLGDGAIAAIQLGGPIANTQVYVLDAHKQPVPVGVPGELYIGGDGLARGYLNRPSLTAERFVPDPFGTAGARLYRTGDLVRWRPDGGVDFLGRIDQQVKIRGFRIEPGEIEAAIARHAGVRDAVVAVREDVPGERRLVAYVVPQPTTGTDAAVSVPQLRAYLGEHLPEYMVPSAFVLLEALPLSPNGKVDRRALPEPDHGRPDVESSYVAPRSLVEEGLADIWADVLRVNRVGVHDDFFELGGHSLLATQIVSRARAAFQVELSLRQLFESPTVAGLASAVDAARRGHADAPVAIAPAPREGELPLSFAQQRLWFLDQLQAGAAYTVPCAIRLSGPLDADALEQSLNEMVRRHESLRTTFGSSGGRPFQIVAPALAVPLVRVDLRSLPDAMREREAQAAAAGDAIRPFDLKTGPLVRCTLLRLGDRDHVLLLTMHHIVSDGWSLGVISAELTALYNAFAAGQSSPLPELPIQYADFAVWQRQWLEGGVFAEQSSYWHERLRDLPTLNLPTDRPRPPIQSFKGAAQVIELPRALCADLADFNRRHGATLFMTLLAAMQTLLHRYTGQDDIVVGSPIANRNRGEIEKLIGFFVNSLVMRTDLSGNPTFQDLLGRVRDVVLGAYDHQDLPFEKLVEELQPERDLSRNPLFQVDLVVENAPLDPLQLRDLVATPFYAGITATRFDLELLIWEHPDGITAVTVYSTDLFDRATVERMMAEFITLLQDAVRTPERRLAQLALVTDADRRQLAAWNATAIDYPRDICLHELIEAQVAKTPAAVAVVFEGEALTYAELNARANQLAHRLVSLGVGREVTVGVCLDRSADLVVSLLAILKAGGAYVPVDPSYPRERILMMLADAQPPVLITDERLAAELAVEGTRTVCLDRERNALAAESTADLGRRASPDSLAYVIFTSGSTGRPKGAMNAHVGICNRLLWMQQEYGLTADDRVLQKTPFSFDVSVWEFFWPLIVGARLVVAKPGGHQDPAYLVDVIAREAITTLHFVPSMLQVFLSEKSVDRCRSLVRVICSGEALGYELQQRFYATLGAALHNLYGPTEAAVDVTYWACLRDGDRPIVPIGRPVANTELHILDRWLQPVPVGVAGELHLGGIQVGRGYLRRPDLTAEKFIPDPFSAAPGSRMYRTGDLARFLGDGTVEYLGRLDHQVKIRGVRIELGEIEATLNQHPAVRDAIVLAREDTAGDKRLVAYVVPSAVDAADAARDEWDAQHVAQWQMLYDDTYGRTTPEDDPTFNIVSWNSSYTGLPIPADEMREWVDQTVDRIVSRSPRRVLEIGCGTGLLLWRVAPSCERYTATDFSKTVIASLQAQLDAVDRGLPQVELKHQPADRFEAIEPAAYDAVVLNSVVQYFPGIDYLVTVLEGAVRAVAPGGFILIGDVRSLPLLEAYHTSVQLHRAPESLPVEELQQRVRRQLVQEEELVVDPGFFPALARRIPAVSRVIVRLKRGRHHNELTRFRYDVVLEIGSGEVSVSPSGVSLDWRRHALSVDRVRRMLVDSAPERLTLTGIPNARLATESRAVQWVLGTPKHGTVGELREALAQPAAVADPETLAALGEELGYAVDASWSDGPQDGSFDVVFRAPGAAELAVDIGGRAAGGSAPSWRACANNPLHGTMSRKLVPQIRAFVEEKLPTYLMPSAFILLDSLPLSPNGKIDRRALPAPDYVRPELRDTFEPPRTPTEQVIAGVFSEVLGIDRVGVNDSFFQLGGHSLLATQVVSRVFEYLQAGLEVRTVFERPTPAGLAASLLEDPQTRARTERIAEMLISLSDAADEDVDALVAEKRMLTGEAI